jgi:competence protein ComFC
VSIKVRAHAARDARGSACLLEEAEKLYKKGGDMNAQALLGSFVNIIAPAICGSCGSESAAYPLPVCRNCRISLIKQNIPPYVTSTNIEQIYSLRIYRSAIKSCLRDLKFRGNRRILDLVNEMLGVFLTSDRITFPRPDIIIPVPLHPSRYYARGYNQSELISLVISEWLSIPVKKRALVKIKNTSPQSGLKKFARKRNLKGAFRALDRMELAGRNILLVDDIITTGTTLDECASELLHSGAETVTGLTIARTI